MDNMLNQHLTAQIWREVNEKMIRKIITEFVHEGIVEPIPIDDDETNRLYRLDVPKEATTYYFSGIRLMLDHLSIDPGSLKKEVKGHSVEPDAVEFLIEFRHATAIADQVLPDYLEEVIGSLNGMAYTHTYNRHPVKELIHASYQEIEHAMTAGHPCYIANSGKLGFDAFDYRNFAPEAAIPFKLIWLAGHRSCTEFTAISTLTYEKHLIDELGIELYTQFQNVLRQKGVKPEEYIFFPVHPWQWQNKLPYLFAGELASDRLVLLGESVDTYLPQQSVRTLFNISGQGKCYVKTALSILNMGFMRGLSPYFMRTTPSINEWVHDIISNDPFFAEKKFFILREIATVGYTHQGLEDVLQFDTPYKKMLSCLWREHPSVVVKDHQTPVTMAALLHVDAEGGSMLTSLVEASGLSTENWLRQYLDLYLSPLLHSYYAHDMRFMPHGENIILILENFVPVGVIMKDIGEEIAVLAPEKEIPPTVERVRINAPEELRLLSIFTQPFDCFLRFLNEVTYRYCHLPEEDFWRITAEVIASYQQRYPELNHRFSQFDLFTELIPKTCLNRLQMNNNKKLIDASNPFSNQIFNGFLTNPLAKYKPAMAVNEFTDL